MIAYASRTGTRKTLDLLRRANWRLLVSAKGVRRHEGFKYACDNGAWSSFLKGEPFDTQAYRTMLNWIPKQTHPPDWMAVPDIVEGGLESLKLSEKWMPEVLDKCELGLLVVQDGMRPEDVRSMVGKRVGIFLGGSTAYKLETLYRWGEFCSGRCYYHVGRVNTAKRIKMCAEAGADSFDGTSVTRFPSTIRLLDHSRRQMHLFSP